MSQLIQLRQISLSYGAAPLFEQLDLSIAAGERVCLVGRNGVGKSTLLKVLEGEIQADEGEVIAAPGLRIARLAQEVPQDERGSVAQVVAAGLGQAGALVSRYQQLVQQLADHHNEANLAALERCQQQLEASGGWHIQQQVQQVLSRLRLDGSASIESLSGGLKRRVLLARALVCDPQLLMLDEPTNHLDIAAIQWLEDELLQYSGAIIFITHDRGFLRRLATRIIELDRGQLTDWPGDYDNYLRRKQELLAAEEKYNALFDKRLAAEEVWIRQGIKARRTRNEGRVRALQQMRRERAQRRTQQGQAKMAIQEAQRSGKIVVEAESINFAYGSHCIVRDFSTTIMRGDKVGLIGPNGMGKTTLLRLLLGELEPQSGHIRIGTKLDVAYFDQYRSQLDEQRTVQDSVADGEEQLTINGKPRHVISYLQDFLFIPQRARQPVAALSGGERNRLMLARLFTRPSNMLVLDEPTNDLDIETLDLLEELLIDYQGTVLLVSHDRVFLDNVVTSTLAFAGDGVIDEYVGGYEDWLRQRPQVSNSSPRKTASSNPESKPASVEKKPDRPKKRSYKDQRELDALPARIESLETAINNKQQQLAEPDFYRQDKADITRFNQELSELEQQLSEAYARWEALEE
ncbi:MAG: ATP-binding cassette domain-containing protein [Wenzhouxiangellaceae bacterium]